MSFMLLAGRHECAGAEGDKSSVLIDAALNTGRVRYVAADSQVTCADGSCSGYGTWSGQEA